MVKNEEWKKYVKEAKLRLKDTTNAERKKGEVYCLRSRKLTSDEVERMDHTVREIVASDTFVCDPLSQIMDKSEFDVLNDEEKMKYLLDLSSIYLNLRKKIEKKG